MRCPIPGIVTIKKVDGCMKKLQFMTIYVFYTIDIDFISSSYKAYPLRKKYVQTIYILNCWANVQCTFWNDIFVEKPTKKLDIILEGFLLKCK